MGKNAPRVKLVSWNVCGLRSVLKKGFLSFVEEERPDVICLQETRCPSEIWEPLWLLDYHPFFNVADKKGYSGTATFTRVRPQSVTLGIDAEDHGREGRTVTTEFDAFYLVNVYVPNVRRDLSRLAYRQHWDRDFLAYVQRLQARKPVVFCGDLNVAHRDIDLARPKANLGFAGCTVEERRGFENYLSAGFLDSFREFEPAGGHYTWWSNLRGVRDKNVGWRIDYFLLSGALRPRLRAAFIRPAVRGSDHCPVGIELDA